MYGKQTTDRKKFGISMMAAALLLGAALAAAQEPAPDDVLAGWLGKEFTVQSSTLKDPVPIGGKLTFVLDPERKRRACLHAKRRQAKRAMAHGLRQALRCHDDLYAGHALLHGR